MTLNDTLTQVTLHDLKQRMCVLSPLNTPSPKLIQATHYAGYWSILELGDPNKYGRSQTVEALDKLKHLNSVAVRVTKGFARQRWKPQQLETYVKSGLIKQIIINEDEDWEHWASLKVLAPTGLELWVEVKSLASALKADQSKSINGLMICTEEAAGVCGDLSVYMWLQNIDQLQLKSPLWIRGGMSLSGIIASLCIGIERVILDEHLLGCAELNAENSFTQIRSKLDRSHSIKLPSHVLPTQSSLRILSWPQSKAWQIHKAVEKQEEFSTKSLVWGEKLDQDLIPLSSLWPLINESSQQLTQSLGEAPRCHEILNQILEQVCERLDLALKHTQAEPTLSPLCESHQLKYPLFQGPMTRVSDNADFALAVAEHGAMPFIALSLLTPEKARALIASTQEKLGHLPWGIGILGFSPPQLREAHLKLIMEFKPNAVLIAGGRPSQCRALEDANIPTYLHAPSPQLLKHFIEEGARRFIFEGAECGGHIGPSNSFALWDAQLAVIENSSHAHEITAIFAGGIHDACSAGILKLITAKAVQKGVKVGALMGTAYLFTHEAVQSEAILNRYQEVACKLKSTAILNTAPGHSTRCAPTDFVAEFQNEKKRLEKAGLNDRELWEALEKLNVGRLRIASKGIQRDGDHLLKVDEQAQIKTGMYMIGELASLRNQSLSMAELHNMVSLDSFDWLKRKLHTFASTQSTLQLAIPDDDHDIAIVGISCLFPKAQDHHEFWSNILEGLDCLEEIPSHRWSIEQYYDPEAPAGVKSASKWGAFLDAIPFDPMKYGIPPQTLSAVEPVQLLALEVAARALEDAGYMAVNKGSHKRAFNRESTSVIFGAEAGTELASAYTLRGVTPQWLGYLPKELEASLPKLTEDSFAGVLANVISGRIANRLDLGGVNYTVDAACASSLAALDSAVKSLRCAESDMVICGGADLHNSINDYLMFSSVHALSKTGKCKPFSQEADGIALGEGIAALVLKRVSDARRDGDRIYALISSVAGSSDGKALGLTAPREEGQIRALKRAYQRANISSSELGLIEAHGTGTVVGDRTELNALTRLFQQDHSSNSKELAKCSLGSVKSMIGHTKCAAGLAGVIKATMAIYHKVRPPTLNLKTLNEAYQASESPFCFERTPRPWLNSTGNRLAGVSAFGFGGTNFHAVLKAEQGLHSSAKTRQSWAVEPVIIFADHQAEAKQKAKDLALHLHELNAHNHKQQIQLRSLAYTLFQTALQKHKQSKASLKAYVLINASTLNDLELKLKAYAEDQYSDIKGIYTYEQFTQKQERLPQLKTEHLAFVFPGQGAQKVGMMSQLFTHFPKLFERLESAPEIASIIFPPHPIDRQDKRQQQEKLTDTRHAQPALGLCDLAMHDLLNEFGLSAGHVAGHSYGELVALCVAGHLPGAQLPMISQKRGELILEATGALAEQVNQEDQADAGSMAAVTANAEQVAQVLNQFDDLPTVVLANLNAPQQTVISGSTPQIEQAIQRLKTEGLRAKKIAVACAFHSRLVASAASKFQEYLEQDILRQQPTSHSDIKVWSNQSAQAYQFTSDYNLAIGLGEHLASPVRFVEQITAMIKAGVRVFVEVGPGRILSGLIQKITESLELDEKIFILPCAPDRSNTEELLHTVLRLSWLGYQVDWQAIWRDRSCEFYELGHLTKHKRPKLLWWIDGMKAWPDQGPKPANYLNPLNQSKQVPSSASLRDIQPESLSLSSATYQPTNTFTTKSVNSMHIAHSFKKESLVSSDPKSFNSIPHTHETTDGVALAAKAYFESMQNLAQAQERVMLALLGQGIQLPPSSQAFTAHSHITPNMSVSPSASNFDLAQTETIDFWGQAPAVNSPAQNSHSTPSQASNTVHTEKQSLNESTQKVAQTNTLEQSKESTQSPTVSIKDSLIDLVSERTGYPAEMLSLDLDLEADLSIDSIKRIEILGALAERLGLDQSSEAERDQMIEELAVMKTLAEMITWLEQQVVSEADGKEMSQATSEANANSQDMRPKSKGECLPRALRVWVDAPLKNKLTKPNDAISFQAHSKLLVVNMFDDQWLSLQNSSDQLNHQQCTSPLENLFLRLKELISSKSQAPQGLLVIAPRPQNKSEVLASGGLSGLLKTFSREWKQKCGYLLHVRLVLVDKSLDSRSLDSRSQSLNELIREEKEDLSKIITIDNTTDLSYVRYLSQTCRQVEEYQEYPLELKTKLKDDFTKPEIILVTGGARGVTAHCVQALAKAEKQHVFILLGRTPHPSAVSPSLIKMAQACKSEQELRAKLITQNPNINFAELKSQTKSIWAQAEIQTHLEALESKGVKSHYLSVDITAFSQANKFTSFLNDQLKPYALNSEQISTVIHAAGTIDDQFISDKSLLRFQGVLKPKLQGIKILLDSLVKVKTWIFFSSVSAALGNQGQSDYAAANASLDTLADFLNYQSDTNPNTAPIQQTKALSIQWGPWQGAGMVDESLANIYAQKGLKMISLQEGAQVFVHEWQNLHSVLDDDMKQATNVVLRSWPFSLQV